MVQNMKKIEEADKVHFEQERVRKEKAIKENMEANRMSIELKIKKKNDEKDLEKNVLRYLHEKDMKEESEAMEKR